MENSGDTPACLATPLGAGGGEHYRALFDAIDQGLCIIELLFDEERRPVDCRFIEVNPAFERQTGLKDAVGRRMRELAPGHEEEWFQICGRVAVTREPLRITQHARALHRWFDVHAVPIGEPEARQVAILFEDVTHRRRMEEDLRQGEEQLRLIFESATEYAMVVSDCERKVTRWNSGAERLLGYTEKEILGRSADILFTEEDRASGQPQKEASIATEKGRAINERWHRRKDGTRFWGSGLMFPLRDSGHAPSGFLKIMQDRTAEREVEENLRQSEERLRLAIETAELGTWEYNPNERVSFIDERTRELFGVPPDLEPTYDVYMRAVHPGDRERVNDLVGRVLRGEGNGQYQDEYRILRITDGMERWVRAAGRVYFDAQGRAAHVIGTVLDISDLMKAREVLTRRSEELERTVEERTRQLRDIVQQLETFSYSVVHDMRAPLRSVQSFANILEEDYGPGLDDTARGYLRRLQASVARMDSLITDVLTYSRVNSSEATLTPVDLDQLMHEIVEQYPQFQESRQNVVVQSPLPIVLGNRALLTQCISNLLDNALKFMPDGRTPRVVVRAEPRERKVRLWFEDNGIGIAAEYRDRIFGLFQRLHRSDQYPGTGVGLAIVYKAVERMRGSVGIESVPNCGSRFWIELLLPGKPSKAVSASE
jgi:PAS domain S-box-containing protein